MSSTVASASPPLRASFMDGVRTGAPVWLAVLPVGLVFGAIAAQQGLSVLDAMLMSATVYAGASQLVAVDLYGQSVPLWAIVLSVFAVNFRHVLYSAAAAPALRRFAPTARWPAFHLLIDPQFALMEQRRERRLPVGPAWYFGLGLPIYAQWVAEAGIGAAFGSLIEEPARFGLDMILPVYFLGLVMGFRSRPHWLGIVLASGGVSAACFHAPFIGSPWHVSLGALAGIAVAALVPGPKAGRGA